jgi:phospholipid transport system transporter-binding protein
MKTTRRKRTTSTATANDPAAKPVVVLPTTCTFREAADLKSSLLPWVSHPDSVTLDVSALQRLDAAAMQVICAFLRDRHNEKLPVTWEGSSGAMNEAVGLLGTAAVPGWPAAHA